MMASSRGRNRSSPRDGSGFGRIGCLLHQAEEHATMNRAETEDGSYASARNRKLLTKWASKAGESEYAEPALIPCQTTAFEVFTDDELRRRIASYASRIRNAALKPSEPHADKGGDVARSVRCGEPAALVRREPVLHPADLMSYLTKA